MNIIERILISVFSVMLLVFLAGFFLRRKATHSKKMAAEQDRLNQRTGVTPTSTTNANESKGKWYETNTGKGFVAILLLIAIGWLLWSLYSTDVSLTDVSLWARGHWLFVLVMAGALAVVITMFVKAAVKVFLLWALTVVVSAMFVAGTTASWFVPTVICKDATRFEARECLMNGKDSEPFKAEGGAQVYGMQLCATHGVVSKRFVSNNTTYWRFKGSDGFIVRYQLFEADIKCPDL